MGIDAGKFMQPAISFLVVVAFFGTLAILIFLARDLPPGVKEVVLVLTGVLAGAFKDVVGFYIGSSLGSQKKDALK
jgi:hypothetical protein